MKKTIILLSVLFVSFLNAAVLSSDKANYAVGESIKISFHRMDAKNKDWIGIYPVGSSNSWANVVKWSWTKDKANGTAIFKNVPKGMYEARAFYNNSFQTVVTTKFQVKSEIPERRIHMSFIKHGPMGAKTKYRNFYIVYPNHEGAKQKDWVAIYKAGTSNAWENVIKWKWIKDLEKINTLNDEPNTTYYDPHMAKSLTSGNYEIRFFENNSFKLYEKSAFTIEKRKGAVQIKQTDGGFVTFKYQNGAKLDNLDWIAIYETDTSNAWKNVKQWAWVKDLKDNKFHVNHDNLADPFNKNSPTYQIRFFRNNSYTLDSSGTYDQLFDF